MPLAAMSGAAAGPGTRAARPRSGITAHRSRNDLQSLREFATHHEPCLDGISREPATAPQDRQIDRQHEVCGAT